MPGIAAATGQPPWVPCEKSAAGFRSFTGTASPHAVERTLRVTWRSEVENASRWVPRAWRDSVSWTAWLPELDTIGHLLDGEAVQPWMREDALLNQLALEDPDERRAAIEALAGPLSSPAGAEEARDLLRQRITRLLHRRAGTPVAVFCHLALAALELLQLRAGLVRHALINAGATGEEP